MGVDGSGKSTQAALLAAWLREQGVPARSSENPGGRPVLDALARCLGRTDGPALLGRAHLPVECAVRWTALAHAVVVSRLAGQVAVLDRCADCQVALVRARSTGGERQVRRAFGVFARPDVVVLLAVTPALAAERVRLRGRDTEDVAYLATFAAAYRSLPEADGYALVDASGSVRDVQARLRQVLRGYLDVG